MKLAGVVAIVVATTTVGYALYESSHKKVLICRELIILCDCLRRDLMYKRTPINELVSDTVEKAGLKHLSFIESGSIIDNKQVNTPLTVEDTGEINQFLSALGKSDAATQLDLIAGFREYISEKEETYKDNHIKNSSIYLSFGVFSGILIALLLV